MMDNEYQRIIARVTSGETTLEEEMEYTIALGKLAVVHLMICTEYMRLIEAFCKQADEAIGR